MAHYGPEIPRQNKLQYRTGIAKKRSAKVSRARAGSAEAPASCQAPHISVQEMRAECLAPCPHSRDCGSRSVPSRGGITKSGVSSSTVLHSSGQGKPRAHKTGSERHSCCGGGPAQRLPHPGGPTVGTLPPEQGPWWGCCAPKSTLFDAAAAARRGERCGLHAIQQCMAPRLKYPYPTPPTHTYHTYTCYCACRLFLGAGCSTTGPPPAPEHETSLAEYTHTCPPASQQRHGQLRLQPQHLQRLRGGAWKQGASRL